MILTIDSRIIGIDSNNKQVRICRFEVDAISDLPAPDVWSSDGVIICMGSTAHVINDNSEQMLDSSGQWVQQVAGTSSYTRTEIDTFLSAIDAEIDEKIGIDDVFGAGTQISANGTVDIRQLGRFYCSNAATAATVTGAPWKDSGFFGYTERSIAAADRYIQVAFRNDDSFRIAKRRYIGTWQPWSYIDTYDEGNLIPDNANLNDYTQGGKYYGGNSAGNSVSNLPVANSAFNFSLEVKNSSPAHTVQYLTILRIADDPYLYKRRHYNGTWSLWYKFEGSQVT